MGAEAGDFSAARAEAATAETPVEVSNPSRTEKTAKNLNPRTLKETPKYPDGMDHRHFCDNLPEARR
jgi:hypothetical protein